MTAQHFPMRVGRRSRPLLRLFGVRDANAFVDVDDTFDARFGRFHVRTPLANVSSWRIEGPWLWITAIGVRVSIRHRDVTFGLSLIHISEPTRRTPISYAVFCLKKK